jgi:poly(3-hydroxybutyrate) depolymerase
MRKGLNLVRPSLLAVRTAAGLGASVLVRRPGQSLRGMYGGLVFALPPRILEMRRPRAYQLPRFDIDAFAALVSRGAAPRELVLVVRHGGVEREAMVHLPPGVESMQALPVILNFHGFTSDALEHAEYTSMSAIAAQHGFAAVHPQGLFGWLGYRSWNAGDFWARRTHRPADDVDFTRELIERLASVFPVSDWFATGISNGGMLCYRLAHALPGRFSAIAPVAAVDLTDTPVPPQTIGVFHIHGVNDGLVPHDELAFRVGHLVGGFGSKWSVRGSFLRFARRGGATLKEVKQEHGRLYEIWRCPDGSVAQLVFHPGSHTWLGDGIHIGRNAARVARGSMEIVEFFRRHQRGHLVAARVVRASNST